MDKTPKNQDNVSATSKSKLNYWQILLIGFGFMGSSLAWSIYNSQVPLMLEERFLLSGTLIGVVMTIDNFFGVIFQPLVGAWSDKTRTKFGRRMPWILIGIPVCAVFFLLIPTQEKIWSFMLFIIAFNLFMSLWRSPVISLMPDVTEKRLRSQANGIINLMGGLGAVIAFLTGGMLSDIGDKRFYPFLLGSLFMLVAFVVLLIFVREPDSILYRRERGMKISNRLANRWAEDSLRRIKAEERENITADVETITDEEAGHEVNENNNLSGLSVFKRLPRKDKINLTALLIAILAWFMGYNAIETFFTLFATNTFGMSGGRATLMLTTFSLCFLVFAIPAGYIGAKLGKKRTIKIGLIGVTLLFSLVLFNPSPWLLALILVIGGAFWSLVNINSLPLVLEFSASETVGSFTGYYYLFSFTAAILSPILFGWIKDLVGSYSPLFIYAVICFVFAFIAMSFVSEEK